MKNAEKFVEAFGRCPIEVWVMSQQDFLNWMNSEYCDPAAKNPCQDDDNWCDMWCDWREE